MQFLGIPDFKKKEKLVSKSLDSKLIAPWTRKLKKV